MGRRRCCCVGGCFRCTGTPYNIAGFALSGTPDETGADEGYAAACNDCISGHYIALPYNINASTITTDPGGLIPCRHQGEVWWSCCQSDHFMQIFNLGLPGQYSVHRYFIERQKIAWDFIFQPSYEVLVQIYLAWELWETQYNCATTSNSRACSLVDPLDSHCPDNPEGFSGVDSSFPYCSRQRSYLATLPIANCSELFDLSDLAYEGAVDDPVGFGYDLGPLTDPAKLQFDITGDFYDGSIWSGTRQLIWREPCIFLDVLPFQFVSA